MKGDRDKELRSGDRHRIRGLVGEELRDDGLVYLARGCLVFDPLEGYGGRISAVGVRDADPHGREIHLADVRLDTLRAEVERAGAVAREYGRAKKAHKTRPRPPEVNLVAVVEVARNVWSSLDFSRAVYGPDPPPVSTGDRVEFGRGVLEYGTAPAAWGALSRATFSARSLARPVTVTADKFRCRGPAIDSAAVRRLHGSTVSVYLHVIGTEIVETPPEAIPVATLVAVRVVSSGVVNHRRGKIVNGFTVYTPDGDKVGDFTSVKAVEYCKAQGWEMDRRGIAPTRGEVKNRENTPYRG